MILLLIIHFSVFNFTSKMSANDHAKHIAFVEDVITFNINVLLCLKSQHPITPTLACTQQYSLSNMLSVDIFFKELSIYGVIFSFFLLLKDLHLHRPFPAYLWLSQGSWCTVKATSSAESS